MADIELLEGEEWRPVVGYEGQYEVSNMVMSAIKQRRTFGWLKEDGSIEST